MCTDRSLLAKSPLLKLIRDKIRVRLKNIKKKLMEIKARTSMRVQNLIEELEEEIQKKKQKEVKPINQSKAKRRREVS